MSNATGVEITPCTTDPGAALAPVPAGGDIMALLGRAVDAGASVEALERLVALKERVDDRNAKAAFVQALAAFRDECPPIPKTRENAQFEVMRNGARRKSRYAPLEEMDRVARPVAAKHGLTWTWDTRIEGDLMHVICRVVHEMGHAQQSTVSMPYESKAGASPQQKYGTAQTYGMRYSLIAALGLTTADEDVDGAAAARPAETITAEQAADLHDMIEEVGANWEKFLLWAGIERLVDLPADRYTQAVKMLERKRGQA